MGTTVYLFIPLCLFKCHRALSYITLLWLHQHTSDMCLTQEMQHGARVCVTSWMEVIVPEGHLGVVLKGWRRNWIQLLWKWNKKKIFISFNYLFALAMQYGATWGVCVSGIQVIITSESLTHLHGGEFIPLTSWNENYTQTRCSQQEEERERQRKERATNSWRRRRGDFGGV